MEGGERDTKERNRKKTDIERHRKYIKKEDEQIETEQREETREGTRQENKRYGEAMRPLPACY